MSNPEQTEVFRSDQAPEMAIEDTSDPTPSHPRVGPRISNGAENARVRDGLIVSHHYEDAAGPETTQTTSVQEGLSDLRSTHDAEGLSDLRSLHDAEGLSDQRSTHDADGLSDQRSTHDAEGLSDPRSTHDADGLSDLRQLHQHSAEAARVAAGTLDAPLFPFGDFVPSTKSSEPQHQGSSLEEAPNIEVAVEDSEIPPSEPGLSFKPGEDAVPWALSLHLEERIAKLGAMNSNTKEKLDGLESHIQRLAKRIGK